MTGFLSDLKITKHYYDPTRTGPVTIDLHPTLACQNKCYFCISENYHIAGIDRPNFSRKHSLDWETLKYVIKEWEQMGVKSIQLTGGGEPTLYHEFPNLLIELRKFKVGLITNGIKLGNYAQDVFYGTDWVRMSLDASNRSMYKTIKSADNFDKVVDSLKTLTEYQGDRTRPRIGVAYIITPESIDGIVEAVNLLKDFKIDYLQFKDVLTKGTMFNDQFKEKINRDITYAKQLSTRFPILYTSHKQSELTAYDRCRATDYVSVLGADGNVYSCCHLEYIPECSSGSIYDKSFEDIWKNRKEVKIDNRLCWNCRFMKTNDILYSLDNIEDGDFI